MILGHHADKLTEPILVFLLQSSDLEFEKVFSGARWSAGSPSLLDRFKLLVVLVHVAITTNKALEHTNRKLVKRFV